MKEKPLLCPERLRRVPRQFSWIDHRLVRDGHIGRCGPHGCALYLLLCAVGDARGLSYYSDATAGRLLSLSGAELGAARDRLLAAGLIAYRKPFYQVLSLEPGRGPQTDVAPRCGRALPVAEILRQMMGGARP